MFVGHFGVALAAKRAAPRTPLAVLLAAGLVFLPWAAWIERHRAARVAPAGGP